MKGVGCRCGGGVCVGGVGYIDVVCEYRCTYSSAVRVALPSPPPVDPFPLLKAKRVGVASMATECWLGLLMGSDGISTLWEGSWMSPTVVVGIQEWEKS